VGYRITESGPDHDKRFEAIAVIARNTFPPGRGTSKKQAEQGAAEHAFNSLTADLP